ncbi:hypothetical protein FRX31_012461, partial [Thalictrum thalictroides]
EVFLLLTLNFRFTGTPPPLLNRHLFAYDRFQATVGVMTIIKEAIVVYIRMEEKKRKEKEELLHSGNMPLTKRQKAQRGRWINTNAKVPSSQKQPQSDNRSTVPDSNKDQSPSNDNARKPRNVSKCSKINGANNESSINENNEARLPLPNKFALAQRARRERERLQKNCANNEFPINENNDTRISLSKKRLQNGNGSFVPDCNNNESVSSKRNCANNDSSINEPCDAQ